MPPKHCQLNAPRAKPAGNACKSLVDRPEDESDSSFDGRDGKVDGTDGKSAVNVLQRVSAAETTAAASPQQTPTGDPPTHRHTSKQRRKKKDPPCIPNNTDQKLLSFHRYLIRSTWLHIRTIFRSVPSRFRGLLSRKVTSELLRPVSKPIHQHHTTQRITAIPETTASSSRQPNPTTNQSLSSPAPLLCRAVALPQISLYTRPRTHAALAQSRSLA
jgi:hypothetical protein